MRTEVIYAGTVDGAVGQIVQRLVDDDSGSSGSRKNVIYFDGWDGLGASAVLRAIGESLSAGAEFSQVIHIDCSKWESRRAMQRALAEKLQLPAHVMEMFDLQDEEDNYQGVGKGSRHEISKVAREIFEHIQKQPSSRFLVIFNNGSCEEINLENLGFPPLSVYSRNKVLWSFQGGFRLYPRTKVDRALESMGTSTDAVLSAASGGLVEFQLSKILRWEAEEAACSLINIGGIDWPAAVTNCFLYMLRLCGTGDRDDADAGILWLSSDALKHEMQLDADYHQSPHLPSSVYNKLCVLKLSACTFSFTSPPFLCCHNLRLWVVDVRGSSSKILSEKMMDFMTQLRELHVMGHVFDRLPLQGRLHNIRKLRVTDSTHSDYKKMMELLLDLPRNSNVLYQKNIELFVESSGCSSLETVIIDRFAGLNKISFEGCARLKNILLSGSFPDLYSLDLTGTAVETLDLSAVTAPKLDKLFLLDCGKLCAILWPPLGEDRRKAYLGKLWIDTTGTTQKEATDAPGISRRSSSHAEFDWYICPVKGYFGPHDVHVEISTMPPPLADAGPVAGGKKDVVKSGSGQQQAKYQATYHAIGMPQQEKITDGPPASPVSSQGCYMHIQDNQHKPHAAAASGITTAVPGFICDGAKTLHVHDSLFGTAAPFHSACNQLEWCRVERCPNLEHVFLTGGADAAVFSNLRTMCASHLLNARDIFWNARVLARGAFKDLTLLQLYGCPRLMQVFSTHGNIRLESLETLEIMWCGDLHDIIYSQWESNPIKFPNLKCIHLHELPKLQAIFKDWHATVKIRGCWSLRVLPFVGTDYKVECDCEKEWWDRLKWRSKSHLDNYKPNHPRYYKKTMLRGSVLR
ncbi:hypothetical protein BS78_05G084500 [Paspalum vaginatum]|nr:hypothetical protein BS78_05G084500 [Paspalum vaginatum]